MIEALAALCSGCRCCEVACAEWHARRGEPPRPRIFVAKDETSGADIPVVCRSCADRPCALACASGALQASVAGGGGAEDSPRAPGAPRWNSLVCTGCGACAAACPQGVIEMQAGQPLICDGCGGEHACVAACGVGALRLLPGSGGSSAELLAAETPSGSEPAAVRRLEAARRVARSLPWLDLPGRPEPFRGGRSWRAGAVGGPEAAASSNRGFVAHGYAGRVLRVDLSRGEAWAEPLDPDLARKGLGGRGLNSVRLLRELPAGTEPLGPEALLLVGVGPLTGTALPSSGRFTVSARSPQTGLLGDGNAGGHFGPELRAAGFDQLAITGASAEPVYLLVSDGGAALRPAGHLSGLDTWSTTDAIRREIGDWSVQVLAIGRPAELGVRFAGVIAGHSRAAARTGMGAVMGSKGLKAVAVAGGGQVAALHDPAGFRALCGAVTRDVLGHPGYARRRWLGTTALISVLQGLGILPTRHFQEGLFDAAADVSGETLARTFKVKAKSCYNCPVHCSRFCVLPDGTMAEGPEYETLCGFTSRLGNADLGFALRMAAEVNRQGLDAISVVEAIGWLMECAQRGLISAGEADGIDLRWGNTGAIAELVRKIASREGVGDLLAEGALAASRKLGRGSEQYVMQVKGLDMICGDPRGIKAYGLTYAIASRGADHLRAEPFFELSGDHELARARFGTPEAADRLAWRGKAALVAYSERIALLTDSLTMCKNVGLCMDVLSPDRAAALLRAALGWEVDEAGLRDWARGVLDAEREFNLREGLDPALDTLPRRFLTEPLAAGPSAGQVVELDRMRGEYYALRGWGPDGRPRASG